MPICAHERPNEESGPQGQGRDQMRERVMLNLARAENGPGYSGTSKMVVDAAGICFFGARVLAKRGLFGTANLESQGHIPVPQADGRRQEEKRQGEWI